MDLAIKTKIKRVKRTVLALTISQVVGQEKQQNKVSIQSI